MVVRKRSRHGGDSGSDSDSDSDFDCFEIQQSGRAPPSSPGVSGTVARPRRRKQLKETKTMVSSSASKMWSKPEELVILGSILDYEKETKLSYRADWDAFYGYLKDILEKNFSKRQLIDKIRGLKRRFDKTIARSHDGNPPSFTTTDDDEIFKLSTIIWVANVTESASKDNIHHQPKVLDSDKDMPCVEEEHDERVNNEKLDKEKVLDLNKDMPCVEEHERVNNEKLDKEKVLDSNMDVPCVVHEEVKEKMDQEHVARDEPESEHEPGSNTSTKINKGEKEKNEEDDVDEFNALQDALEATTLLQSSSKYQHKKLHQNLKNLGALKRKELADEWNALLAEELQLYARKLIFAAKLANVGNSDNKGL